jgi:hypothetical protein
VWESNPTNPKLSPRSNGFEVRAGHQTRCASMKCLSADLKRGDPCAAEVACKIISEARTWMLLQYVSPRRIVGVMRDAALHERQHLHMTAWHGAIFR